MNPNIEDTGSIGDACLRVMLRIAMHQDEPLRGEMLQVLENDGWLQPRKDVA